ncbi:MAG: HAMP domain-containing histidine kinase [Acutalibacter sp.]|nr:HAMP domain-containing histidine kinase [Acutalibacter sp.]
MQVPQFLPGEKPPKKPLKIRWQIALGFGVFILIIAVLLWVFQIAFLGAFYRTIKTSEVKNTAELIERILEDSGLDTQVRNLSNERSINIVVTDEMGTQYSAWKHSQRDCLLETMTRNDLRVLFNEVNLEGGNRLSVYSSPFAYEDGVRPDVILYVDIVRTQSGFNRMLLIESEITPVDATVETLQVQLVCVTVIMVLLGGILALFIARRISRPVAAVNEAAKELARGNYNIRFAESGSKEVSELAQTLNYAAEELSKVEGLRRELLANVSHDLRTPLTMIRGYGEVMRDLPGENTPENVQIIIDETERLTNLVNDLLDLSRLEAGVMALDVTRFNLTESIRAILHRYDKLAGYSFPFLAEEDVFVTADELKISQVVYNLVNNAITYAGEDKTVALEQTVANGKVRVSVTDTGEGIPEEKLRDIWERYYKVDREHKRAQVGTGLGLSIVKHILELHGGAYGVVSQLGEGSTFWFELPVSPALGQGNDPPK